MAQELKIDFDATGKAIRVYFPNNTATIIFCQQNNWRIDGNKYRKYSSAPGNSYTSEFTLTELTQNVASWHQQLQSTGTITDRSAEDFVSALGADRTWKRFAYEGCVAVLNGCRVVAETLFRALMHVAVGKLVEWVAKRLKITN